MIDLGLRGKVALVTGASRKIGIGAAIARALAAAGANVLISTFRRYDAAMPWGSDSSEADALVAELQTTGVQAASMDIDLSDPAAPVILFDRVNHIFGEVEILVNNAAYSVDCSIESLTADLLDQHYALNVRGMMLLCAEFARRKTTPGGRIVNLTSGQGSGPMPGNLAYAASKGAVDAFTVSLSAELAPRGITVNAVDPGATDTGWMPSELKADLLIHAPMGRIGLPEDAARLVRFLASGEAGWITGQILRSRGGM